MDIIQHLKPLIAWLHLHPGWAGFVTFLISLTESLAVVGYFVPGSVMMTAIGTLIGAGIIPTWSTMIWAIAGAVVGDGLSYRIGYHYKNQIRNMWPISKYPHWMDKGEDFFHRHGGKSVFLGRFVGAVRPMVPMIAGMLHMKPIRFFFSNFFSAVLWAPAYMLPGILIGAATLELDPKTATEFVLWVLVVLFLIGISFWLLKRFVYAIINWCHKQLDKLWAFLLRHPSFKPLCLMLQNPQHPEGHGQLTMALGFILTLITLVFVTMSVIHKGYLIDLNYPIHSFFRSLQNDTLRKIMVLLTMLGDKRNLLPASVAIFIGFLCAKHWRAACHWAAAIVICAGIAYIMKHTIDSSRPLDIFSPSTSYSYPSGHVALTVIFFSFLSVLISHNYVRRIRIAIYSSAFSIIFIVVLCRLYLGAHWFTDTLGAALLGLCTLLPLTISYRRKLYPQLNLKWVYLIGGLVYLLIYINSCYIFYHKFINKYQPVWPSSQVKMQQWWQQSRIQPLYRTNRFGRPIHLINIQWAGDLKMIKQELKANGWIWIPKQTVLNTIGRFSEKSHSKPLPLVPAIYLGQIPALIMVKPINAQGLYLVLQLWNSRTQFTNKEVPLLVGTINYRLPRHHKFWEYKQYREQYRALPPALLQLQSALMGYHWRVETYPKLKKPDDILTNEWDAGTILIKPVNDTKWHENIKYTYYYYYEGIRVTTQ